MRTSTIPVVTDNFGAGEASECCFKRAETAFASLIGGTALFALNPRGDSVGAMTATDLARFLARTVIG